MERYTMLKSRLFTAATLSAITLFAAEPSEASAPGMAPVSGFARSFILGSEISNATITILETGKKLQSDNHGKFGPFDYPIGKPITLVIEKWEYHTTQSPTVIVPPEGLTSPHKNLER